MDCLSDAEKKGREKEKKNKKYFAQFVDYTSEMTPCPLERPIKPGVVPLIYEADKKRGLFVAIRSLCSRVC